MRVCIKNRNHIVRILVETIFAIVSSIGLVFADDEQLGVEKTLDKLDQYDVDEVENIFKEHPYLRDFLYGKTHAMHPVFTFRVGVGLDFGVFKVAWSHSSKNRVIYPDLDNSGNFHSSFADTSGKDNRFQFFGEENYEPIELRKWGGDSLNTSIYPMVFYFGPTMLMTWPKLLRGFQLVGNLGIWLLDGGDQGYTKGLLLDPTDPNKYIGWVLTKRKSSLSSMGPYLGPGAGYVFSRLWGTRIELSVFWKCLFGFFPLFFENTILDSAIFYTQEGEKISNWNFGEKLAPTWVIREEITRNFKKSLGVFNNFSLGLRLLVAKDKYVEVMGGVVWSILKIESTKTTSKRSVSVSPQGDASKFFKEDSSVDSFSKFYQGPSLFMGVSFQMHI